MFTIRFTDLLYDYRFQLPKKNVGIPWLEYVYVLCAIFFLLEKSANIQAEKRKKNLKKYKSLKLPVLLLNYVKIGAETTVKGEPPHCLVFT